jgi:tetratricopeptide (TPR) repeat protein
MVIRGLLAESYMKTGFLGQAESELEKVAAGLAPLTSVYKLQAEIYARQNRYEEASGALRRFLAHHPGDTEAMDLQEKLRTWQMPAGSQTGRDMEEAPHAGQRTAAPELASATLAEIYYSQGRIGDAIQTYEEVLRQNPFNRAASERLTELKGMNGVRAKEAPPSGNVIRARKEKMIGVLENWLAKIRELEHR